MEEAVEAPEEVAVEEAAPPAAPAVEYSEALPFLTRRASLGPKGALVGDVGFDPLGFAKDPAVRRLMQDRELAHGRLGMLAAIGFLAQEAVTGSTWPCAWQGLWVG